MNKKLTEEDINYFDTVHGILTDLNSKKNLKSVLTGVLHDVKFQKFNMFVRYLGDNNLLTKKISDAIADATEHDELMLELLYQDNDKSR